MDVDPLGLHPPIPSHSTLSLRGPPRRDLSTRSQRSRVGTGVGVRDAKSRRSPPYAKNADKPVPTEARLSPINNTSKPLLPASERRPAGQNVHKAKMDARSDKWNITPDGGSAGRGGRHFTVANVGNNGQIFLRPTVRPANQRYPQPQFAFPLTPPSTAGLDALRHDSGKGDDTSELQGSLWTPTPLTDSSSPGMIRKKAYFDLRTPLKTSLKRHRRAMSDSTIQDATIAHEEDTGGFKVVISKPQEEPKSRTTEDIDPDGNPLMQVSIPSWKLGTPRFTLGGTPLIRGSSYAPSEDIRSSKISFAQGPQRDRNSLHPGSLSPQITSRRPPHMELASASLLSPATISSPLLPMQMCSMYVSTHLVIEPAMFDALTFKPACDDRSVVRYSSNTNAVTAATPPRLVAEITSPSFLDYELISDFFLTFRSFLETPDLLRMLIARLRWALSRGDETGMIVKVRTFVAIRHWILNYFVDDFVVDYHLRVTFCNLLNDFVDELSSEQRGRKVQLKILGELKKCWRRVCANFWDGPEFESSLGPEIPIAPGGIAGHRDPSLDPSFWETESEEPPQLYGVHLPDGDFQADASFYADVSKAGHIDSILLGGVRPATPEAQPTHLERQQTSPISIASLDVASCSFPIKGLRMADPNASTPLGAHPADPSSIYTNTDPVASTPRALTGKRVRPHTSHKRNNSLTDSLHGTTTEKVLYKNAEFLLTLPYAGSLVRGNLLPPGQAYVEMDSSVGTGASRQTTIFQPPPAIQPKMKASASAMSGQGMRKLIGSVRRALSTRGQIVSPIQGSFIDIAPIGPRGATINRLPGTAIVPQARPPRPNGTRQLLRVDVLGAKVAEDFKKAVREDAAEETSDVTATKGPTRDVDYSAAHLDSAYELRPLSDAAITTGSKSIVIVDGTLPADNSAMSGGLAALNPSVEAFAESMDPTGANPTPPITPPGQAVRGNTPRRSSFILSQHVFHSSLSENPLPPFVPDMTTLDADHLSEYSQSDPRPSVDVVGQSPNRPPLSYMRRHKRQQSSRSYRSRGSMAHRRWASIHSGLAPRSTVRSFDATTYSEGSIRSEVMPPPLRVLRRRPGGDLKGATKVTDLDALPLHRSRSVGSLTTYSESLRSSYLRSPVRDSSGYVDVVSSDYSQNRGEVFSLGAMAEQAPKQQVSLFSTHSSKPIMRPSFEAEAQKLAQIPDDIDDDGGVESALLKLEGKYERKMAKLSMEPLKIPAKALQDLRAEASLAPGAKDEKRKHRLQHVDGEELPIISPIDEDEDAETDSDGKLQVPRHSEVSSYLSEESRETYNSIPLLDRELTDEGRSRVDAREWTNQSILEGPDTPLEEMGGAIASSSLNPSFEFVTKTKSMEKLESGRTMAKSTGDHSFLDVGSDNDSDLSSEMSAEVIEQGEYLPQRPFSPNSPSSDRTGSISHTHNGVQQRPESGNPSPQLTFEQALQMLPDTISIPELHEHQLWSQKPLPPTPDTAPVNAMYHQALESPEDPTGTQEALRGAPKFSEDADHKSAMHLPFILAFDSEILSQQFTLIEKDALNEVDWKELIDMRWKNSNNDSRSWVDFLRNTDARGVEVVIARFNIMVKWAISEIVLTQNLEERARCIIKYLHIAAHCRRFRNFATMSQIAIALTSNEVARLTRTWAMIPSSDLKTMHDLEALVSPTKNFYNLRAEMEGGGITTDSGCIPFVGIYTHDLLFNSQRPSEIASSPTTAPLVNFERCRIAASVVKTLLRLLEASTHYQFQPIEGITERCLWMGALSDDEIRRHSESLE
ncbi:Uu.00g070240.m01.CDS01 [Anthostomella pinea]|uniref:Uu.00g070240.m01.CDS01 n=1 Tax=Anthostomella pinea TaxID=933095 RepID=A0AAI8VVG2_9PEZI|nr:Uu.00g070240.m01.CDS01 [Anthostomella pinea]